MSNSKNFTGCIQELKGYPLNLLVEMLPPEVTQFTAVLGKSDESPDQEEWTISYITKLELPEQPNPDLTPKLA